jgi:hypothetical protein
MRPLAVLLALGLAAGGLGGQAPGGGSVDVHVLMLTTAGGELVPTPEIVLSTRIALEGDEQTRAAFVRVGGIRIMVTIASEDGGGIRVERNLGRGRQIDLPPGRTLDVTDGFRWGRRPRHGSHVRGALLCEPAGDATTPFVPIDVRGFLRRVVDVLFEPEKTDRHDIRFPHRFGSARWRAALVLGSLPLRQYLDPDQVDRILAAGEDVTHPTDEEEWPLLRPLIALGDRRVLEARAITLEDPDDDHETRSLVPHVPRTIEDSVVVAYASATDPETRGLAGWIALGTRSRQVYEMLANDVESGRAILPGDDERRAVLTEHILHGRAWRSITAPALTLIASALTIAGTMLVLRMAVRRMF